LVVLFAKNQTPSFRYRKEAKELVTASSRGKKLHYLSWAAAKLAPTDTVGLKHSRDAMKATVTFSGACRCHDKANKNAAEPRIK
jgi:hypothetical protein